MTTKRIYVVQKAGTEQRRLIRASNVAQARNHVARDTLQVAVASQDELVSLVSGGARVEDAGEQVES